MSLGRLWLTREPRAPRSDAGRGGIDKSFRDAGADARAKGRRQTQTHRRDANLPLRHGKRRFRHCLKGRSPN